MWMNIAVASVKGRYDVFYLSSDRVGVPLDPRPVFITTRLERGLLQPIGGLLGRNGTPTTGAPALPPEAFFTKLGLPGSLSARSWSFSRPVST